MSKWSKQGSGASRVFGGETPVVTGAVKVTSDASLSGLVRDLLMGVVFVSNGVPIKARKL
jgi:hypothetical protein